MQAASQQTEREYDAILQRDKRYDDVFFFAVISTGIYCRPSCPAPRPLAKNVIFFRTTREAQEAGFRACKRCRPDEAADRKLQSILTLLKGDTEETVEDAARKLEMTDRHLRRTVKAAMNMSPLQVKIQLRLARATKLLAQTELSITEIAFRADFVSIRQFNRAFRAVHGVSPQEFRRRKESYDDITHGDNS